LIEDNAHGHGGTYDGKSLGTFGDMGISSPRKLLNLHSGGILWLKDKGFNPQIDLSEYPVSTLHRIKKSISDSYPSLKNAIKKVLKNRPKYEDPSAFRESVVPDYAIDLWSKEIIKQKNWNDMRNSRQDAYHNRQKFALDYGLTPVFSRLHSEANPWCFPAYINDQDETVKWFKWG